VKKVILIITLLIFAGCSSDEDKQKQVSKPTKAEEKVVQKPKAEPTPAPVKEEVKPIEKTVEKVVEETKEEVKVQEPQAKTATELFKSCAACHGNDGKKAALGKSQIIAGWDAAKTSSALHGYKDGTYGGAMKALMKGQAGFLSDDDIEKLSEYISTLK
jgi:cytochrome c553